MLAEVSKIKTVAEAMKQFTDAYQVPIVPAYRSIVTDLLTTTHLTVVDARFAYDPIFALGMSTIFDEFFKAYPGGDTERIFSAMAGALDLDPSTVRADATATKSWAEGKSEADLAAAFDSPGDDAVGTALTTIKANDKFLYNRVFGVGMFKLFGMAGIETINDETLTTYAGKLNFKPNKFQSDYDLYEGSVTKLRAVEQLFKEIEIREKKKLAARLEEKAAAAAKAAEEAKAIAEGKGPADETPRAEEPAAATQQSAEI